MSALGVWVTLAEGGASWGYQPPRSFTELVALVGALAALVVALGVLSRALVRAVRALVRTVAWVESIHDITTRELDSENGASADDPGTLKDDVHGIAVALGQLQRRADQLSHQVGENTGRLDRLEDDVLAIYDPTGKHHRKADI